VWVRVNDRGPYIANRLIDLSYAAAQKIGLIEPGVGDVDIKVLKIGSGEREAPAAFDVTIAALPKVVPAPAPVVTEAPAVEFPLPVKEEPAVVDRVVVETQRGDVVTRKQVAGDGKTIEEVPTGERRPVASATTGQRPALQARKQFVVQVGAFAVEANAKSLLDRLTSIGQTAFVDRDGLFRVRIGPFATRELAAEARASLEANGLSAIILAE
jgi:rare lipoprotein A